MEGLSYIDISLLDGFKETIEALFLFIPGEHSASSQLPQELVVCDGLAAIEVELGKQQLKLAIADLEA